MRSELEVNVSAQKPLESYVGRLLKDRKSGWMPIHILAESSFCEYKVELMLRYGYEPTDRALQDSKNHIASAKARSRALQEDVLNSVRKGVGVCVGEVRLAEPALKLKGMVDQLEIMGNQAIVTEFKYTSKRYLQSPWPSHRLQSHAYGYMVDAIFGVDRVDVAISYLDIESRNLLSLFTESLDVQFFLKKYISAASWWCGERPPMLAENPKICPSCKYALHCDARHQMKYISEGEKL